MRPLHSFILAFALSTLSASMLQADGFFKWKDARGNTQYGDKPPKNVQVENFRMPEITVIEGYNKQWQPLDSSTESIQKKSKAVINKPIVAKQAAPAIYTKLALIAPRNNQVIRGQFNGEVSAMLSIKPPLKNGHKIVFFLDGKEVSRNTSRVNNFSNLRRGEHSVIAKIVDQRGNMLISSESAGFRVMRK